MNETAEALDALVASEGWRLFAAHAISEWGAGGTRFEGMLTSLADGTDDTQALMHIRQVAVARREILRLLEWPQERMNQLRRQDVADGNGHRTPINPVVASVGRRGTL